MVEYDLELRAPYAIERRELKNDEGTKSRVKDVLAVGALYTRQARIFDPINHSRPATNDAITSTALYSSPRERAERKKED